MKRIRILHVAQCAGGVDCYLRMLFSNMDSGRFENILLCSYDFDRRNYSDIAAGFIQMEMRNALSFRKDLAAVKQIRKVINAVKPDIIYCHSSKAGGLTRLASVGTGMPVVYNPHGWAFRISGSKAKSTLYLWLERALSPLTTQFIAISNYEKLIAVEKHIARAEKIKTIFNGIDTAAIARQTAGNCVTRRMLHIPESACLIGMTGRICKQKAPDVFVRTAAKVVQYIPDARFIIVGDGDERAETERLIRSAGLSDRFVITGWVANPLAYASLFDIAVLLSRWEGFGLVLAEYMALGKPIVAAETDAIPDLITNRDNGLLVNADNCEQAALAIREIYDNKELRNEMIRKGKLRAEAFFNVKRTAKEHELLFEKMLIGGVKNRVPVHNYLLLPVPFHNNRRAAA